MRKLALGLSSCLLVALLLGAVLEVVLRLGWIHNSQYARRQIPDPPAAAEEELLILGDSFVIPLGMQGRLLTAELAARDVGVRNVAASGTGPFEYLDELKRACSQFEPETVLLSYYAGNDLTDVQNHPRFRGGSGIAINRSSSRPFLRNLYLYHYLRAKVSLFRARLFDYDQLVEAGIDPELIEDARSLHVNPYLLQLALHDKNYFLDNVLMATEENMEAWTQVQVLLSEIHAICRRRSIPLLVVMFPHSIQVNETHFDFFRRLTFQMDERTLTSARPQELMRKFCAEREIPLLDLLPAFRERADEELYLEKDDHLNEEGNGLAVQSILAFVEKH